MKNLAKRTLAMLMALVMCISLLSGIAVTVSAATVNYVTGDVSNTSYKNVIKNWGKRGVAATFLSPNAEEFYSDNNITYEDLAALSGSSSTSSVPSSALYLKLQDLMENNHTDTTSYGDVRYLMAFTDIQENGTGTNGTKISTFYSGLNVGPDWDSGSTWNREHVWPNSKGLNGSDENDIMMLRPENPSINSGRGNSAFGESDGYEYPNVGDYDVRGDVARILLYIYVRWGNTENMWGKSGVMESKEVLLKWMEEDPVDTWEMGRNDSVESITGTRNVFVDYPELAFDLFNAEVPADMTTPSAGTPDVTYTVTATSNNESYGTVEVDGYTITATVVKTNYTVGGYTVTSGDADVVRSGNVFTVYPKSDCTVQITFRKLQEMSLTFSDASGKEAAEAIDAREDSVVTLPEYTGTSYDTHTFVGWIATEVADTTYAPLSLSAGWSYLIEDDVDFLALYSYVSGGTTYYTTSVGCVHENTTVSGAKDATCTTEGYTGDTVCSDCGMTLETGATIDMLAHSYEDGTCSTCGAPEPAGYERTAITDIATTDKVIITMTTAEGVTYALSSANGTSSAPTAVVVTVDDETIADDDSITDDLLWNVGASSDGYVFYPNGNTAKWLYCTNGNNGVRVGTNTANTFVVDSASGYLKHNDTSRYLGVYLTNPDWRCYTSPDGQNIVDQTLGFYAMAASSSDTSCEHTTTTVTGIVEATCTTAGYTGNTVCTACGVIVSSGTSVTATGHTDSNGDSTCDTCGTAMGVVYTKTELADITSAHQVIITMTNASGVTYALPNDQGTKTPTVVTVTVENDTIATEDTTLLWNIVNSDGNLTIYPNGNTSKWLYCLDSNTGVRVGTGEANAFTVESTYGYLFNSNYSRYLGVYNNADWRCYTTTPDGNNIKDQTLAFYAYKDPSVTVCDHTSKTVSETVEPTCLEAGYTKEVCDGCGQAFTTPIAATGHNFVDGACGTCGEVQPVMVTAPVVGTAYKWAVEQASLGKTLFFSGAMNGYYGGTVETYAEGVDVYLEEATDGYYITFNDSTGAKKYINVVVSGSYINFTIADAASTVYTYDETYNTMITTVDSVVKYIGTYGTYNTFSVADYDKIGSSYPAHFYVASADAEVCKHENTTTTTVDATCTEAGSVTVKCDDCGITISTQTIEATGHTDVDGDEVCDDCDADLSTGEAILASGKYIITCSNDVILGTVDGTWITQGNASTYWTLTVSGETATLQDANGTYIAPKGGNNNGLATTQYSWSVVKNEDGTYSFYGQGDDTVILAFNSAADTMKFRSYKTTTVTGNSDTYPSTFTLVNQDSEDACKHENQTTTTVDATCTEAGSVTVKCDDCGITISTQTIEATGHTDVDGDEVCDDCDTDLSTGAQYVGILMSAAPADGDTIVIVNGTLAMTSTASGAKLAGETATVDGGTLTLTDAMAQLTVSIDENGYYTFVNADGKYLTSATTGNGLSLADAASDYSLWTVESAGDGLFYIKSVNAKYNSNVQSLEYYYGFTTYGHNTTAAYQMALYKVTEVKEDCQHENTTVTGYVAATCLADGYTGDTICSDCGTTVEEGEVITCPGHSMDNGVCTVCGSAYIITRPVAGVAYKWGLHQQNLGKALYFTGAMNGYYGATTDVFADGVDVYLEEAEDGYYIYFMDSTGAKKYINVVVTTSEDGTSTYNNFTIADEAATVYEFDTFYSTVTTFVDTTEMYIGTYGTYSTFSVSNYTKIDTSFPAHFYENCEHYGVQIENAVDATCTEPGYTGDKVCPSCGKTVGFGEEIPATGHSYEADVTAPTCTEAGYTTYTCGSCGDSYVDDETEATGHSYVDGTCITCGEADPDYEPEDTTYECKLAAIEVSYEAEVQLMLKFFIPEELLADENAYVVMTLAGEETKITAAELLAQGTDSNGRYVLKQGVASGQMTMDVSYQIIDGNGNAANIVDYIDNSVNTSVTRSVLDYARLALEKGTAAQKNIVSALLVYGGYSQAWFNKDAENPAYNVLTEFGREIPDLSGITADTIEQKLATSGADIGIQYSAQTAYLDSALYLRTYFVLDEGASINDYTFTLTYVENYVTKTMKLEPVYESAKNRYYVDILDIPAAYWDYMYKITVTNAAGDAYEVDSSVMAWVKRLLTNSNNANQIMMGKAMYYYNQAANEFFGK